MNRCPKLDFRGDACAHVAIILYKSTFVRRIAANQEETMMSNRITS